MISLYEKLFSMFRRQKNTVTPCQSYDYKELKLSRIRLGLKQYEVAAKIGIAPSRLSEFESGRRNLPKPIIKKLEEVYAIQPA